MIPSSQPSRFPSVQPVSSPSSQPSSQPTTIPTTQPFAFPTSAPVATIYQTNGVLFLLGETSGGSKTNSTARSDNDGILGTSYILFGRNFNHQSRFPLTISLSDSSSREFISEIDSNEGGIRHDITTRSTTIVGDINGDSFLDLLIGYPLASKCSVFLGNGVDDFSVIIATTGESFAIVGDPYDEGGFLGWSSIRIGDLNGDGLDELIVSAIYANTVYIIYGKRDFTRNKIYVNELQAKDGFKIVGHPDEINFGVSLTLLHDFRKGSRADLAITAQSVKDGQNVIYILFGLALFKDFKNIEIKQILYNSTYCMKILTPAFSYAGFSVAGIGDINSDGYDDLAIGSVPYNKGFNEQKTYIVYGRNPSFHNELELSGMTSANGFIITGGGFIVVGVGDLNFDGIPDVMITSYNDWNGQRTAYLISTPANITYSPSLQPTSTPTATTTAISTSLSMNGSTVDNSTVPSPTLGPSFRPSVLSSQTKNSTTVPSRAVFAVGTAHPSQGNPSETPTLSPTSGYHHLRGFSLTASPTMMPTINTTIYTEISCSEEGSYQGKNRTHNLFRITANAGLLKFTGSNEGEAKNIYVLYWPKDPVNVVIENFRLSTDMISVFHLTGPGYSYSSLNEIPYSSKSGPLTLFLCSENKLQVVLSSLTSFELQDHNFLFKIDDRGDANKHTVKNSILARVQIGVVFGVLFFLILVFFALSYQNKQEEKEKLKHEELLLNSLTVPIELLPVEPAVDHSDQKEERSFSSSSNTTLVTGNNHQQEESESESEKIDKSDRDDLDSINSNDWLNVIELSDGDDVDDSSIPLNHTLDPTNEPVNQNINNSNQEILPDGSSSSSSTASSDSSFAEGSVVFFEFIPVVCETREEENNTNDTADDISIINSGEWENALALSDDEDET
jgi:hypothetical protein